jgi:hypothetical protein
VWHILQSNYDLLFYKTYRRNSSEYYFEKEPIIIPVCSNAYQLKGNRSTGGKEAVCREVKKQ